MREYETPKIQIINFEVEELITYSVTPDGGIEDGGDAASE